MKTQEILDSIEIGASPLTGRIYIGIPDKDGCFKFKSDFTERLKKFVPQIFEDDGK